MDAEPRVKEEVDERRCRTDEDGGGERGEHRSAPLGRLMHVLRVAAHRPEHRSEQQGDERTNERPRGNAVGERLQGGSPWEIGRRGT